MEPEVGRGVKRKGKRADRVAKIFKVGDRIRHVDKNKFGVVRALDVEKAGSDLPPRVFVDWDQSEEEKRKRQGIRKTPTSSSTVNLELVTDNKVIEDVWAKIEFTVEQNKEFVSAPISTLEYGKEQKAAAAEKLAELGLGSSPSPKWRIQNRTLQKMKGYVAHICRVSIHTFSRANLQAPPNLFAQGGGRCLPILRHVSVQVRHSSGC